MDVKGTGCEDVNCVGLVRDKAKGWFVSVKRIVTYLGKLLSVSHGLCSRKLVSVHNPYTLHVTAAYGILCYDLL